MNQKKYHKKFAVSMTDCDLYMFKEGVLVLETPSGKQYVCREED